MPNFKFLSLHVDREIGNLLPKKTAPAPHLAHLEGCASLRIMLVTVPCLCCSCEHFPDRFDLNLIQLNRNQTKQVHLVLRRWTYRGEHLPPSKVSGFRVGADRGELIQEVDVVRQEIPDDHVREHVRIHPAKRRIIGRRSASFRIFAKARSDLVRQLDRCRV